LLAVPAAAALPAFGATDGVALLAVPVAAALPALGAMEREAAKAVPVADASSAGAVSAAAPAVGTHRGRGGPMR
jgi:prephenate dehydrogenase